jgi:phage shock protein A
LRLSITTNEAEALKAEIGMLRGMLADSRQANKQLVKEVNILRTKLESLPADMRKECAKRKIAEHFAEENMRFLVHVEEPVSCF